MSKKGIEAAARESSGKSRKCGSCPLCTYKQLRCTTEISWICNESHIEGFKKGVKHQREHSIERKLVQLVDKNYGRERFARMVKLQEEIDELKQELVFYLADYDNIYNLTDEMSDVVAVITHLCSILGTDLNKLLKQAYKKVKGREKDPNYKRKHPHE